MNEVTPGYEDMYGGMKRILLPRIYAMAESQPYRFWDSYKLSFEEPKFLTAEHLMAACCQWVVWMEQHPLYAEKSSMYQGVFVTHDEPRKRVLTKASLLTWLNSSPPSWDVRWPKRGEDWEKIRHIVETWIYQDKFEGVNSGFYNAAIIASDLGLSSRISAELSGGSTPVKVQSMNALSEEEVRKTLAERGLSVSLLDQFMGRSAEEGDDQELVRGEDEDPEALEAGD